MNDLGAGGIPIARILGIEVRIHLSWVLILAIIAASVSSQLTATQPSWGEALRWSVSGAVAVLFLLSVLAHELAHAVLARRLGMGGGSVTLLFFGGAAIHGVQPARARDDVIVAAAGPIASGIVAVVFLGAFVAGASVATAVGDAVAQVAIVLAALNLLLALLNLLPVYPLDGGRILRAAIWRATGSETRATRAAAMVSRLMGWLLIAGGVIVILGGDPLDGTMLAICGWFLSGMARSVERRLALEELLRGLRVENVMERGLPSVAPQLTLDTFAAQYLASGEGTSLPVMRGEALMGLIGLSQLRRVRRAAWPRMRAADVMVSPPALPTLHPDDELWGALERLRGTGLDGLPVLRGQELLGVLTRRGLVSAIKSRSQPPVRVAP